MPHTNRLLKYQPPNQVATAAWANFSRLMSKLEIGAPLRSIGSRIEVVFDSFYPAFTACRRIFSKVRMRVRLYAAIVSTNS